MLHQNTTKYIKTICVMHTLKIQCQWYMASISFKHHAFFVKAILQDLTTYDTFYFSLFFHHIIMKWPWLSPYFKTSLYSYWLLCIKLKIFEYRFSYTKLQYELYRDPGKGNVIADSVITKTHIAFISSAY